MPFFVDPYCAILPHTGRSPIPSTHQLRLTIYKFGSGGRIRTYDLMVMSQPGTTTPPLCNCLVETFFNRSYMAYAGTPLGVCDVAYATLLGTPKGDRTPVLRLRTSRTNHYSMGAFIWRTGRGSNPQGPFG